MNLFEKTNISQPSTTVAMVTLLFCLIMITGCDGDPNSEDKPNNKMEQLQISTPDPRYDSTNSKRVLPGNPVEADKSLKSQEVDTKLDDIAVTPKFPGNYQQKEYEYDRPAPSFAPGEFELTDPSMDEETKIHIQIQRYNNLPNAQDRLQALEDIGDINVDSIDAINTFISALQDPDKAVRLEAIVQLADSESYRSIEGLLYALDDHDPDVVMAAVDSLEFLDDASLIPELESLLSHPNPDVRDAADEAVEFLSD